MNNSKRVTYLYHCVSSFVCSFLASTTRSV